MSQRVSGYLLVGGICGLAWASALRGWMAQLADGLPDSHSQVTWATLALVLLPGTIVGALLAYSVFIRVVARPISRWLIFSPALFAVALVDPKILAGLVRNGTGGGSLIVIATALAIGRALTLARWSFTRVLLTVLGALGLLVTFFMGGLAAPLGTPRGTWVCVYGFSLVLLLGLASALPYRPALLASSKRGASGEPEADSLVYATDVTSDVQH